MGVPLGLDVSRNFERGVRPVQRFTGSSDFRLAQCCAVALFLALLVRRTETDDGLAADQGRLLGILACGLNGGLDLVGIVAVDIADHLPTVGLEALGRVVGKPAFDFTVDGDAVVVVERNQLAQTQSAGQ